MSMYFVICKQLHRNNIVCDFINLYVLAELYQSEHCVKNEGFYFE